MKSCETHTPRARGGFGSSVRLGSRGAIRTALLVPLARPLVFVQGAESSCTRSRAPLIRRAVARNPTRARPQRAWDDLGADPYFFSAPFPRSSIIIVVLFFSSYWRGFGVSPAPSTAAYLALTAGSTTRTGRPGSAPTRACSTTSCTTSGTKKLHDDEISTTIISGEKREGRRDRMTARRA